MKLPDSDRLFLTELDKHHPKNYQAADLRPYIIMQSLFMPQVLTADAQFNNNPSLRALIFPKEGSEVDLRGIPADLAVLIKERIFVPAIREGFANLREIRQEHIDNKVLHTPSEEYVDFVDAMFDQPLITWDIQDVGRKFKERVIDEFSRANNSGPGGMSLEKALLIQDYSINQGKLLFAKLNDWLREGKEKGVFNQRDLAIAYTKVSEAYRHNVPISMRVNMDVAVSRSEQFLPIDIRIGNKKDLKRIQSHLKNIDHYELPPLLFLSKKFLQKVPAEALIAIKGSQDGKISPSVHYERVMKHLANFRSSGHIDFDDFIQDLIRYLEYVEYIFLTTLPERDSFLLRSETNRVRTGGKIIPYAKEGGVSLLSLVGGRLGTMVGLVWSYFSARRANIDEVRVQEARVDGVQLGLGLRGDRLVLSLDKGRTLLPSFDSRN